MSYPTLEQYNEALQHPDTALIDPELKKGSISTTGLGLPLALCGGFALTYTVKTLSSKYAVRCFHKKSNALEQRYAAISNRLRSLHSLYFLNSEFQTNGVRVNGKVFPIVKMAWASGDTLGEFLERQYRNTNKLQQLNLSLHALANYLEVQSLAHGDIQPGNVMVSGEGRSVQLIDYDGMFVEAIRNLGSAELGHRNFQHPRRTVYSWDSRLDRFSFIVLNLAIRVLQSNPELWNKTQSDGDTILFKANDYADPNRSMIFNVLYGLPQFAEDTKNLAVICNTSFEKIPTLENFLARKQIPKIEITVANKPATPSKYISTFPVLNATNYTICFQHVGDRVELIGKIFEIKEGRTRYGKPYIFINFGPWKGEVTKINIWSEGLSALTTHPDQGWIGKWISVIGLMEPPYRNSRYNYSHLSISITQSNQLHVITETVARFRLGEKPDERSVRLTPNRNKEILETIGKTRNSPHNVIVIKKDKKTSNQAILDRMKKNKSVSVSPSAIRTTRHVPSTTSQQTNKTNNKCFIATALYGADAPETNRLRAWRDRVLMPSPMGNIMISTYYNISPPIAKILTQNKILSRIFRIVLKTLFYAIRA